MSGARFGIAVFPGSNCDRDCEHVLRRVLGLETRMVWHLEPELRDLDALILPGGFSYGDYLRPGAIASVSPLVRALGPFVEQGGLVLGICNGFQILCEARLLPGALITNLSARFRCRWAHLRVERAETPFTCAFEAGEIVRMPIAHRDGRYLLPEQELLGLESERRVLFRYVDERGEASAAANPNGSLANIAGVIDRSARVCGLMPHPERASEALFGSESGRRVFESMAHWIAEHKRVEAGA